MVSRDYYENTYLGTLIPQKVYPRYAKQAAAVLERLERTCQVEGGEDARSMAQCAMAEVLYRRERFGGVESASAGELAVRYRQAGGFWSEVYQQAAVYLKIYRGCS